MLLKGVSLWLPSSSGRGKLPSGPSASSSDQDTGISPPPYHSRVNCAKLLLELSEYNVSNELMEYSLLSYPPTRLQRAYDVLEGLLCEDDEVVGVWYLMGWLCYLTKDNDSARFYLQQTEKVG